MALIYTVDDDNKILESINRQLTRQGYEVCGFNKPELLFDVLKVETPELIISDIIFKNSELSGVDVLQNVSGSYPDISCIVISGESDIEKTLKCMKLGAMDFIEKPVSIPRLITSVKNAITLSKMKQSLQENRTLIGNSKAISTLRSRIVKLAKLNEPVLITGESGTGKELVAENLHAYSGRFSEKYLKVNCTALNSNLVESELFGHKKGAYTGASSDKKGYFEIADKGTLFVDEIGDFNPDLQAKLLRVLQEKIITRVGDTEERRINTRLLFATHQDLEKLIEEGTFRNDLFFRISTFKIQVPALRDRIEDIPDLADHFLKAFIAENNLSFMEFSTDSIAKLCEYTYPGNIRELISIVKNAATFCDTERIGADMIEFDSKKNNDFWRDLRNLSFRESKAILERELIRKRLEYFGSDVNLTAESLGMHPNNLYRKMKDLGIKSSL